MLYSIFLFAIPLVYSEDIGNTCAGFQANFDLKNVSGGWHLVAIIPETMFPDKPVICYKMEISKAIEAPEAYLTKTPESIILRQKYYTESPYEVWSKSIPGVKGCFQQIMYSVDVMGNNNNKLVTEESMMQLHLLEVNDSEPFLMQMFEGKIISALIYRRAQGVTQRQLKPAFQLINNIRKPQRLPRICNNIESYQVYFRK